jgi:hypothetical protein
MRQRCLTISLLLSIACCHAASIRAQSLYEMQDGVETRWASPENPTGARGQAARSNGGRKGAPNFRLPAGESRVLAEATGTSGTIRRIWMTISDRSPKMLRGLRLDFYWDGAATPAVSAPLGDFFGIGLGQTNVFQSALFANPEGRSFNCLIPMPFRIGMKMVMTNESGADLEMCFYDVDYTIGDKHGPNTLYFHAHYRRENPTRLQQDYAILPKLTGRGRYLGVNIGVAANQAIYYKTWWGEGEVKVYLDGDQEFPTLSGTGTEDYIGTAWGQGLYSHMYQGCPFADEKTFRYCFYRYHVLDPVYFHKDIRVTIQQIGFYWEPDKVPLAAENRKVYRAGPGLVDMDLTKSGLFERQDDWSSCAYFYLDRPENGLPPLDAAELRIRGV